MGTLEPQRNGPLHSNTVIGTLAVDGWAVTFMSVQEALLSQRGCAMFRVCQQLASIVQYVKRNLLLVTSASDLPLRTINLFCSLVFSVLIDA